MGMVRVSCAAQLLILVLLVMGTLAQTARPAAAQTSRPQSLHILEIDSDDADDQAEAMTGALRSRARSAPGWVLLDTTQSLSMLTAALRCPQRPDPQCLQRIGDQLKAERFIWGVLTRQGAGPHQVTAELHFWARGKPDVLVKETYSDNLKDQGDDTLRKIASRSFDRLTGGGVSTITLHAGSADGIVIVDGDQKVALQQGSATLVLSPGTHAIEVQAAGFVTARQSVNAGGGILDVNIDLRPAIPLSTTPPGSGDAAASSPGAARNALKWGTLIGGSALLVAGAVLGIVYESERSSLNSDKVDNYGFGNGMAIITDPCNVQNPTPQATNGCSAHNTAQTVLVPEVAALGVGAVLTTVGIVLVATGHTKEEPRSPSSSGFGSLTVVPSVGPRAASVGLSASF